jgi:ABC-2 type transport system permease protein
METRIRRGDYSPLLLRPVHPFHVDTAGIIGSKVVELFTLIPTMLILALLFRPTLDLVPWAVAAFLPALFLGFALRYVLMYAMSLTAFWTTRVSALFQLFFTIEFFVSGRIAPVAVLPDWAQPVATGLPFVWMFGFPLELVLGRLTPAQSLAGFGHQLVWLGASAGLFSFLWRRAVRHYSAVGG